MKYRTELTAMRFNVLDRVKKLENELLGIDGVKEVEFDLDGFYDSIKQVIFLVKYDIPVTLSNYYERRKKIIGDILTVAENNRLKRTGDRIEDYGEHFYFVTSCEEWKLPSYND